MSFRVLTGGKVTSLQALGKIDFLFGQKHVIKMLVVDIWSDWHDMNIPYIYIWYIYRRSKRDLERCIVFVCSLFTSQTCLDCWDYGWIGWIDQGLGCSCRPALGDTVMIAQIKNIGTDVWMQCKLKLISYSNTCFTCFIFVAVTPFGMCVRLLEFLGYRFDVTIARVMGVMHPWRELRFAILHLAMCHSHWWKADLFFGSSRVTNCFRHFFCGPKSVT